MRPIPSALLIALIVVCIGVVAFALTGEPHAMVCGLFYALGSVVTYEPLSELHSNPAQSDSN